MFLKSAPVVFLALDVGMCPIVVFSASVLAQPLLRKCESSTGARSDKMGEREVEPEHGFTFLKGDSEAKEEPQAGFGPHCPAVRAAAHCACSVQETAL